MDTTKQMCRDTLVLQRLENCDHLALGADHAYIASPSVNRPAQYAHVVTMSSRNDDDIGSLVGFKLPHGLVKVQRMHFASGRKSFLGSV